MKDSLILQDNNYISAKRVQELFGYTSDYVGQLCRSGKIEAKMIGRSWFVTERSIINHKLSVNEILRDRSREKRKLGKKIYKAVSPELPIAVESVSVSVVDVAKSEVVEEKVNTQVVQEKANTEVVLNDFKNVAISPNYSMSAVPDLFALPYFISQSFLIAPNHQRSNILSLDSTKLVFTSTLCILGLLFMFQSLSINTDLTNSISRNTVDGSSTASVLSSSEAIVVKITSFFTSIPKLANSIFKNDLDIEVNEINNNSSLVQEAVDFNGFAVVPSTNSVSKDETIKNKIRDSFSDEVVIKPDNSGTAGIITPVFREAKGSDFIYVLVPVTDTEHKAN